MFEPDSSFEKFVDMESLAHSRSKTLLLDPK